MINRRRQAQQKGQMDRCLSPEKPLCEFLIVYAQVQALANSLPNDSRLTLRFVEFRIQDICRFAPEIFRLSGRGCK